MTAGKGCFPPPVRVVAEGDSRPEGVRLGPLPSPVFESMIITVASDDTLIGFSFSGEAVPGAVVNRRAQSWMERLFARSEPVPIGLYGTAFQRRVWSGLLNIPQGQSWSYGQLAAAIGHPRASRAVGAALGANPIGWLVPCHRVVRSSGALGGYAGGITRKEALLDMEGCASGR